MSDNVSELVGLGKWKRNMFKFHNEKINKDSLPKQIKDISKTHVNINTNNFDKDKLKQMKLNDKQISQKIDNNYSDSKFERLYDLRRAAEIHKTVRRNVQDWIKPGVKLVDICDKIENEIVQTIGHNDLKGGIAFPTGVSINNCVCHDTANYNDTRTFDKDDICKIDFGVHLNGNIIDCAFSACFNPEYEQLLNASKEATYMGIKMARPDASIYDISSEIKEVIESHEVTIKGKTYDVKAIKNLGGHSIDPYDIHSGQLILCAPCESKEYKEGRIKSDQQYAIETFASTGSGNFIKSKSRESNHYMSNKDNIYSDVYKSKLNTVNNVHKWIKTNRSTLAFCPRWLENEKVKGVSLSLNEMARKNNPPVVVEYHALDDINGSLVSHFEHTIYVHDNSTEVLTFGDDY